MNQVARYLLVIALASSATYFISDKSSEINLLEMKLARWQARSDALENELVQLRRELSNTPTATPNLVDKSCEISEIKKTGVSIVLNRAVEPSTTGEQKPSEALESKELDDLLLNGEIDKALDKVRNDLDPAKRIRLIAALSNLKDISVLQNSKQYEESDPEYLRSRIDRSIRILEVNRVFERELGMGVSQFINLLDSSEVEDVSNN